MALKPLNSVGGFSVGETPSNVIDANLNFTGNTANFTGNLISVNANLGNLALANFVNVSSNLNVTNTLAAGNVRTDNLLYANGSPWDLQQPAGSNTQVQFNNNNDFGASANFTFDSTSNTLSVLGNANVTTLNTGNINTGTSSLTLTANGQSTVFNANGVVAFPANVSAPNFIGNVVGNISGNITAPGSNTNIIYNDGNLLAGSNAFSFSNATNTVSISNALSVTGNITSGNANLGNLAIANFVQGTLTTAAQPNVTSVGILTGLSVDGSNITLANGVYVGNGAGLTNLAGANVTGTVANATHASTANTVTDAAQPNITSVGTLTSLTVTGNASAGNLSTGGALSVTGNANVGNLGATGVVATTLGGTLTTAAQPNITSVGTLTGLGVNGNITAANITANTGVFTGNGSGLTALNASNISSGTLAQARLANSNVILGNTALTLGATVTTVTGLSSVTSTTFVGALTGAATTAGTVTTNAQPNITSVGTLTSVTVSGNANVGNLNSGNGNFTGDLTVLGNANIGNGAGGTISGANLVSANFLAGTLTTAASAQPNITSVGTLSSLAVTGNVTAGNFVGIFANGNSNIAIPSANGNINISAGGTPNELVITSTGINVAGTLNATGNANVGNLGAAQVLASANVTAPQLISNVTTGTAPFVVTSTTQVANLNVAVAGTAGTVTTAAQPNITSVGTLSSLTVSGNATAGNVYANSGTIGASLLAGTLTTAAQPNITSVGTLSSLSVTGNANVGNIGAANGVFTNVSGNGSALSSLTGANVTGQVGNALVAGTVYTNAQPNITSVGTLSNVDVTGNGIFGNVYANAGTIAALTLKGEGGNISNITAGNITGQVANALVAGTVYTNAQPNITSVGTLTDLTVSGNASAGNLSTGGNLSVTSNANIGTLNTSAINSGTSNLIVTVNGNAVNFYANGLTAFTGNVSAPTFIGNVQGNISGNITAPGSNTNIIFNDANLLAGSNAFTFNKTSNLLSVTGNISAENANLGNLVTANFFAGTLTTAAQPNITSVGTLTSLDVTGNISTAANIVTNRVVGNTTGVTIEAVGVDQDIELKPTGNGTVDVWNKIISNVATPIASTDAATKGYVDAAVEGLHIHAPCAAATPNTLAVLSGGTVTYNNGTAGVGANLVTTGSYTTIDSVNIANVGTRILVKNEANAAHNGIYVYTSSTVLTRATDFDTPTEMAGGDFTFVSAGTLYNDTGWVMTDPVTTVGTSPVTWYQFSGAGTYTAGTGLTLNGTEFSISNTTVTAGAYGNGDYVATFTVNAQGQLTAAANTAITANAANLSGTALNANIVTSNLTTVGTLGSLSVTGNATAGNVYANSGTIGASLLAGTLTTAAQPNITSVGNLSSLNVTGNVVAANFVGVLANGNSNVNIPAANGNVNISAVGNANVLVVTGTGVNVAGTLNATGNVTVGNLTTAGSGGNITGANVVSANTFLGNLQGILANGTSNVSIPAVNGNINLSAAGNANILVVSGTGVNVAGTLNATGNANVNNLGVGNSITATGNVSGGNLSTGGTLSVTGNANVGNLGAAQVLASANVTAPQFISNVANGTAPLTVLSSTLVANLNADLLDGYNTAIANTANTVVVRDANGNVSANYFTGNGAFLTGIDTSLIANGNSNVSVIANGNVTVSITGTANTAVFSTSGLNLSGNLLANVVKANSQVQVGNTQVRWAEVTTSAITSNQAISTVSVTGITGVEWLVKGVDSSGGKYSVATVTAVTNGTTVDYSIFGAVNIGSTTGTLAVNISGGNIELQVTPSSIASTVWVTQYRTI